MSSRVVSSGATVVDDRLAASHVGTDLLERLLDREGDRRREGFLVAGSIESGERRRAILASCVRGRAKGCKREGPIMKGTDRKGWWLTIETHFLKL